MRLRLLLLFLAIPIWTCSSDRSVAHDDLSTDRPTFSAPFESIREIQTWLKAEEEYWDLRDGRLHLRGATHENRERVTVKQLKSDLLQTANVYTNLAF
jgi:hypothetical protein